MDAGALDCGSILRVECDESEEDVVVVVVGGLK